MARCIDCLSRKKCPVVKINTFKQIECKEYKPNLKKIRNLMKAKVGAVQPDDTAK